MEQIVDKVADRSELTCTLIFGQALNQEIHTILQGVPPSHFVEVIPPCLQLISGEHEVLTLILLRIRIQSWRFLDLNTLTCHINLSILINLKDFISGDLLSYPVGLIC